VLLFMTLAILVFNFYPLTAVMIVMLALLNDGAILSIAYDNVLYRNQPEAWDMRVVLSVATVLASSGSSPRSGCLSGERVFHLDRAHIQTLMYLKLSVAGHLTIFSDAHARSVLVHSSGANPDGRGARHANHRYLDRVYGCS